MLRVALKKLVRKKVKKFAFDHCKTCSERFVIWRANFSFIFQRKEDKEMSEKRCYSNLHRERISYSEKAFALKLYPFISYPVLFSTHGGYKQRFSVARLGFVSSHFLSKDIGSQFSTSI